MRLEMMGFGDGSGISWTMCKQSAHSKQINIQHHITDFCGLDVLCDAHPTVLIGCFGSLTPALCSRDEALLNKLL